MEVDEEPKVHRLVEPPFLLKTHKAKQGTPLHNLIEQYTSAHPGLSFSQRKSRGVVASHGSDLMEAVCIEPLTLDSHSTPAPG